MAKEKRNVYAELDLLILSLILIIFGISIFAYGALPDTVPAHWNYKGEVDAFGPKWVNLFILPVIILFIYVGMTYLPRIDPHKERYEEFKSEYTKLKAILVLFFSFAYLLIIGASMGVIGDNFTTYLAMGFGLLFVVLGYLMPSFKRNWFVGIRTPWTLSSEKVWDKTHQIGGKTFMVSGLLTVISAIFLPTTTFFVLIVAIGVGVLVPFIYSYLLWKKIKN